MIKCLKIKSFWLSMFLCILIISTIALGIGCSSSSRLVKEWQEPLEQKVLIIGNILVENINQGYGFENWGMPIQIVLLGKDEAGIVHKFETSTDEKGYFFIANVPHGQYLIKEIVLPVSGGWPVKIVNDWDSPNSRFYQVRHPEQPTDYVASWFPPKSNLRVIDFNIMWFGLRTAQISDISEKSVGEILFTQKKESLKSYRFYPDGTPYSRAEPHAFFQGKFPESEWWKL